MLRDQLDHREQRVILVQLGPLVHKVQKETLELLAHKELLVPLVLLVLKVQLERRAQRAKKV